MSEKKKSSSEPFKIQIECVFEDLSEAQVQAHNRRQVEYNEFSKKFDDYTANKPDVRIERGHMCTFLEFVSTGNSVTTNSPLNGISLVAASPSSGTTQAGNNANIVVNNQRVALAGLIVPTSVNSINPPVSIVNVAGTNVAVKTGSAYAMLSTKVNSVNQSPRPVVTSRTVTTPQLNLGSKVIIQSRPTLQQIRPETAPMLSLPVIPQPKVTGSDPKPIGPPTVPTVCIDLTGEVLATHSDVVNGAKTYPSLVVMAKPCIRGEEEAKSPQVLKEKQALDAQVRRVLLFSPQNFTEWLMQTGLLRCDHYCLIHKGEDGKPKKKLKLGQYANSTKYPHCGGYIWVSDCCPLTNLSVFTGSIFEGGGYPPSTTLKLIYHWACQTSIQNILQWVNVSNVYIKNLFAYLRSVCVAAVDEHFGLMGGPGNKLQMAVVTIGSHNMGPHKRMRVDILCLFDPDKKMVRMRVVEQSLDVDSTLKKFTKYYGILAEWVHPETILLIDNTIDKALLQTMSFVFPNLCDGKVTDKNGVEQFPNYQAIDYLKTAIPKMIHSTLPTLSRQVIQQFLDELCWRERWGPFPAKAFDTIIKHLIEQTKINSGGILIDRLSKIGASPFKNWKYSNWRTNSLMRKSAPLKFTHTLPQPLPSPSSTCGGQPQKIAVTSGSQLIKPPSLLPSISDVVSTIETESNRLVLVPGSSTSSTGQPYVFEAAKILLEPYFYGTIPGMKDLQKIQVDFKVRCVICLVEFTSNEELSTHLVNHALTLASGESKFLCKLCHKVFGTSSNLNSHHIQSHYGAPKIPNSCFWCLMCNVKFRNSESLIPHLTRYHGELELPYWCRVCNFRTSIFMYMIRHVTMNHGRDDTAFCPYCFQSFHFYRGGQPSAKVQYKLISHVQRHQLPLAKKCYKCLISCLNKNTMYQHDNEHHLSYAVYDRESLVQRYSASSTIMPAPLEDPIKPKIEKFKWSVGGPYKAVDFPTPVKVDVHDLKGVICIECDGEVDDQHFLGELLCMKCDFSTCCIAAMNEHVYSQHNFYKIMNNVPVILENDLHCSCSFATKDGNLMASHLVQCGKTTCYMNPTDEQSTSSTESGEDDPPDIDLPASPRPPPVNLNVTYTVQPHPSTSAHDATYTIER